MRRYVICRGIYEVARLEHSYARRAQSTVRTLSWKQCGIIEADTLPEAIEFATEVIRDWVSQGMRAERWMIEGRGAAVLESQEIMI
jgi:hypothetical protein